MKRMKYLLIILLLIPFMVLAKTCDSDSIQVLSLTNTGSTGYAEEKGEPTLVNNKIKLNVLLHEVGDSITYTLEISNDSDEDVMIDSDMFESDSDYLEYSIYADDNTNVIEAGTTKIVKLRVSYVEEIDTTLLTNGIFSHSSSMDLAISSEEEIKELEPEPVEDNIPDLEQTKNLDVKDIGTVENPKTGIIGVTIVIFTLLTVSIAIIAKIKYDERHMERIFKPFIFILFLLPVIVYALCECNLEISIDVEIEPKDYLSKVIKNLANEENACVTKYEGDVTDQVGVTKTASKVYFDSCEDKRNVLFGGYCWQVIRTTETGGTKLLYNGEPVNGKCESNRSGKKGYKVEKGGSWNLRNEYLYGSSFTQDPDSGAFTIEDTESVVWSDDTYRDLMGKYTCKSTNNTCTVLYKVFGKNNSFALLQKYSVDNSNYAEIAKSLYNSDPDSISTVGYMYNKKYLYSFKTGPSIPQSNKFSSSFTYDSTSNLYSLSGTTKDIEKDNWSTEYTELGGYHYTCIDGSLTCSTLYYVFYVFENGFFYMNLENGNGINDLINDMLYADDVNTKDSDIKVLVDEWFKNNMEDNSEYLEDAVYCNNRGIIDYGNWDPTSTNLTAPLKFKNSVDTIDLTCSNITDQFSVSNDKAKLTYPVGLMQKEEQSNLSTMSIFFPGVKMHTMSPDKYWNIASVTMMNLNYPDYSSYNFGSETVKLYDPAQLLYIITGGLDDEPYSVRPVVSLRSYVVVDSGTGTEDDPWIVE